MKVRELIGRLSAMDQDAEVVVCGPHGSVSTVASRRALHKPNGYPVWWVDDGVGSFTLEQWEQYCRDTDQDAGELVQVVVIG